MDWKKSEFWLPIILVVYLLIVGIGAVAVVIINFPTESSGNITFPIDAQKNIIFPPFGILRSSDQGLALLAFLAGIAGSFLQAAQSLSSFIGNKTFKTSWTIWYFLRPWIGGVLGITFYFAIRAGIIAGASTMNPYVVVAFGLLAGWFSKTTTDKLQEVFSTLFVTNQDAQRHDKLSSPKPIIENINPPTIDANTTKLTITGQNFLNGATVLINNKELHANFVSEKTLDVSLDNFTRPAANTRAIVQIKNPEGTDPLSKEFEVKFQ